MEIKEFLISDIKEYPENPRIKLDKSHKEYKEIKQSIEEFGLVEPLIVNKRNNVLISGHQRLNILKDLGKNTVEVSLVDLSEEQEKQLLLIMNKVAGRWDYERLYKILNELGDKKLTGFSARDFEDLKIKLKMTDKYISEEEDVNNLEISVRYGEKINLDNNILKIGDVCCFDDIKDLVGDNLIDLVIADPPYNVNLQFIGINKKRGIKGYSNDNMSDKEYYEFCYKWINNFYNVLKPGGIFYIFNCGKNCDIILKAIKDNKLKYHQLIIWDKTYPMLNRVGKTKAIRASDFLHQHELIFYGWKEGKNHYISKEASKNISDIWSIKKVFNLKMQHIAEKPQELIERMLLLSSNRGENILDLFSGSGCTLYACQKNNRRCFSIEIDLEFAQRIINRYNKEFNNA